MVGIWCIFITVVEADIDLLTTLSINPQLRCSNDHSKELIRFSNKYSIVFIMFASKTSDSYPPPTYNRGEFIWNGFSCVTNHADPNITLFTIFWAELCIRLVLITKIGPTRVSLSQSYVIPMARIDERPCTW